MSSDDDSDEEFTLKPLRKSMKLLRNEITTTLESLQSIQSKLQNSTVLQTRYFLESLFPKILESGVKGPAIYDYLVANLPPDLAKA